MKNGILAGLRVTEVSAFVAAPMAGATLASMGADVIRVEQRGGGIDAHRWPLHKGRSHRAGLDQGKRSVTLDLRAAAGQELAADLIVGGGPDGAIVVTNLATKGWMAYERLAEKRPDLIMLAIVGSPGGGSAVDYTINAGVGFPWVTGPEDWKGPVNHVLPAWDLTTGLLAASAVLAAERHRRSTGEGQLVKIALSDVAIAVAGHLGFLAEAKLNAEPRGRFGNDLYGTYARDFRTADGTHIMVCALTPRQWTSLVSATRLTEAFKELEAKVQADLTDEGSRFMHRRQISALLEPWIAARSLAEVGEAFDAAGVLWGPYRTFQELVRDDPQATEPYASPISFGAFERAKAAAGPDIGADTADVLSAELGLTEDEIAALRAQAVID